MSNALINGSWQLNNLISTLFCMHVQTFHSEPTMFPLHHAHELETFELDSLSVYRFIQKTKFFFSCVADWSSPAKYICALIVTRGFSCCAVSSAMYFSLFILTFCSLLQQWSVYRMADFSRSVHQVQCADRFLLCPSSLRRRLLAETCVKSGAHAYAGIRACNAWLSSNLYWQSRMMHAWRTGNFEFNEYSTWEHRIHTTENTQEHSAGSIIWTEFSH